MIVYSFQPNEVAEQLQRGQAYICDASKSEYIETDWNFKDAYQWLISRMNYYVGEAPPNVVYPAWVWIKCGNNRNKPDRREMMYNRYGSDFSLLELSVNDDRILPSCFSGWHDVLNGWSHWPYDNEKWNELSEQEQDDYIDLKGSFNYLTLEDTWENIFNVNDKDYVQGTMWIILPEDLVKAHKINRKPFQNDD